jgi:hypothetical protein
VSTLGKFHKNDECIYDCQRPVKEEEYDDETEMPRAELNRQNVGNSTNSNAY